MYVCMYVRTYVRVYVRTYVHMQGAFDAYLCNSNPVQTCPDCFRTTKTRPSYDSYEQTKCRNCMYAYYTVWLHISIVLNFRDVA